MTDHIPTENQVIRPAWIFAVRMTGRCADGAERDGGHLIHAVELTGEVAERGTRPGWQKALCGKAPGRKGNGWSDRLYRPDQVNCTRCARILDREVA